MIHTCKYCGKEFNSRKDREDYCFSRECINKRAAEKYLHRLKDCICSVCGSPYKATGKQLKTMCPYCAKKSRSHMKYTYIEQPIVCRKCGKFLGMTTKIKSKKTADADRSTVCEECKKENYKNISRRMKVDNPSYKTKMSEEEREEKRREEQRLKKERSEISRKITSERMKTNNPMFRKDVVDKMRKTTRDKILSGELVYAKGKDRRGFVGASKPSVLLRRSLSRWTREKMTVANFTCSICGKHGGILHVHHNIPFRDIVREICNKYGYDGIQDVEVGGNDFNKIEEELIKYHHENFDSLGTVVCPKCHSDIDPQYRKRKEYDSESKNN